MVFFPTLLFNSNHETPTLLHVYTGTHCGWSLPIQLIIGSTFPPPTQGSWPSSFIDRSMLRHVRGTIEEFDASQSWHLSLSISGYFEHASAINRWSSHIFCCAGADGQNNWCLVKLSVAVAITICCHDIFLKYSGLYQWNTGNKWLEEMLIDYLIYNMMFLHGNKSKIILFLAMRWL